MTENTGDNRHAFDAALFLTFGIVSVALLCCLQSDVWAFEDTAHYTSMARLLLEGRGLVTDLVYYSAQAQFGTIPAPQTVFPPGYSIAIAASSWLFNISADAAAQAICYVSYAILPLLLFMVARDAGVHRKSAYAVVLTFLSMVTGWVYVWSFASDIPFIALILLCICCCRYFEYRRSILIGAGIVLAIAFSFRYVAVFLVATLGIAALLRFRLRIKQHLRFAAPVFAPVLITMAFVFGRNHRLVGTWRGGNNYDTSQSFIEVAEVFYYSCCRLTGFSKTELLNADPASIGQLISGLLLAVALLRTASLHRTLAWLREATVQQLAIFLFCPIYLAFLFYLDMTKNAGMSTRLLLPIFPFAAMTIAKLAESASAAVPGYRRILLISCSMLIVSFGAGQWLSYAEFRDDGAVGRAVFGTLQESVDNESLLHVLRSRLTEDAPILSSQPQLVNFFLHRPLLGLPTDYFNTEHTPWTRERSLEYCNRFGIRFVLLLTGKDMSNDAEFFIELEQGIVPDWLKAIAAGNGFVLFEVTSSP